MNKELNNIGLPPLKIPKAFAIRRDQQKEVLIMNNLRKEGFLMTEKKKGVTLQQSLLVAEELGRFHASSLLFQQKLKHPLNVVFEKELAVSCLLSII